jgi:hypothetical protein
MRTCLPSGSTERTHSVHAGIETKTLTFRNKVDHNRTRPCDGQKVPFVL